MSGRQRGLLYLSRYFRCASLISSPFTPLFCRQLETDSEILIPKAKTSLDRYGHQLVIGNLLHTRKYEVVLVSRKELIDVMEQTNAQKDDTVKLERIVEGGFVESWLRLKEGKNEIEEDLIAQLVIYHNAWIHLHSKNAPIA